MSSVVHAQLAVADCTAELYLNGIPVSRLGPGTTGFESVAVEALLVPGSNVLELLVEPGPRPTEARSALRRLERESAWATGRLLRFAEGELTQAARGALLCEIRFPPPSLARIDVYPQRHVAMAELGAAHGRWLWQDAPPHEAGAALTAEAAALLTAVRDALVAGSAERMWRLSEHVIAETLRAYPVLDNGALRRDLEAMLAHHARAPMAALPLRADHHDFRLVAGGRMLECLDDDWLPSLRLCDPDDGSAIPYPITLARIDGRLAIVR